ncbi:RNA polymerase sigma factor [Bacteroides ilei]|uniref:RNA polymerase sigma factor n=1 Tax=Bacteroides ilei TaxID=1907658 RepID=UPI0009307A23|nr:RNA polymerase sigma factor [Bacteroides ilei]
MKTTSQNEKDFLALLETHKRIIYKVCYMYTTDTVQLDDLYQETVLNLWKAFPSFRRDSSSATWIYRISLNTCISFRRKSRREVQAITLPVNMEISDENDGNRKAQLTELYRLIHTLGPLERALILLWLEERSYEEIAQIIGLTKTNVGVRLNRIKEKLKNMSNQ